MRHFHELTVKEVRRETEDTVSVHFDVPEDLKDTFTFIQGQYLTLRKEINGEDVRRSYSICSGVHDGELRVAIKKVEGGRFSTYANESLQAGDTLEVMPPMGKFYVELDGSQQRQHVGFAAGSGITPMLSLIKTTLVSEPESTFTLFYVNRTSASIIFRDELEDLKDRYMSRLRIFHLLTREPSEIPLLGGRIDEERCGQLCKAFLDVEDTDAFFVCGPEPMIHAVKDQLKALKVPEDRIHFELFTSPAAGTLQQKTHVKKTAHNADDKSTVQIVLDGSTIQFDLDYDGDNILDAALGKGADLPFSCKGGVCCTCRAKLVEGEVDMDVNYSLEPDEVERGFILTCQAHPRSEKVVVDFDQQ